MGTSSVLNPDHPNYNPVLDRYRNYYEACCDWTGSACVEKTSSAGHLSVCKIDKFIQGYELVPRADYALFTSGTCESNDAVEPSSQAECEAGAIQLGLGDGGDNYGELGYAGSWTGDPRPRCTYYTDFDQKVRYITTDDKVSEASSSFQAICKRADKVAIKCPHGYSLSMPDICELDPLEISLQASLQNSVITFNTYPPDCPEQTFTHSSENVWMGDHPNTNNRRKVIVDGETITCANL